MLMMAEAAQRYGIVVRDDDPVLAFYAQDPISIGTNPCFVDAATLMGSPRENSSPPSCEIMCNCFG
jgi:hypothetical protein